MPYPEEVRAGRGQPYEVYLQALEEIGGAWASVGVGRQRARHVLLPARHLGDGGAARALAGRRCWPATCSARSRLSEADAGSDPAGDARPRPPRRRRLPAERRQGVGHPRRRGRLLHALRPHVGRPLQGHLVLPRRGRRAGPHARAAGAQDGPHRLDRRRRSILDDVPVAGRAPDRRGGRGHRRSRCARSTAGGSGSPRSPSALAQAALDHAVAYARERKTFGKPIIDHQGLAFLLADMAAAVESARARHARRGPPPRPRARRSGSRPRSPSSSPPTRRCR